MKLALLVLIIAASAGAQPSPDLPSRVSMIMFGVENIARSVEFYRDTLGLKLNSQSAEFAFFSAGSITLALGAPLGRAVLPRAGATEIIRSRA